MRLLALFLITLIPIFAFSYTVVSGNVSGQTWTSGIYVVTGGLAVDSGSTLTINSGVIVKFHGSTGITAYGRILATGATFTSWYDDTHGGDTNGDGGITLPNPGNWGNITCWYSADVNHFSSCAFYYGSGNMLTVQGCVAGNISHCTFALSSGTGLFISSASQNVEYCSFSSNGSWAAQFNSVALANYPGCTLTGNVRNAFYFTDCSVSGNLNWTGVNSFHPVVSNFNIPTGSALQIEPGAVIKNNGGNWTVAGSLTATGTAEQPIIITSYSDDSCGGDTNGDGSSSTPAPGNWGNITCWYTTAANQFQYCEFYYGSGNMLTVQGCVPGTISHCTFVLSSGTGLFISSASQNVEYCSFSSNGSWAAQFNSVALANYPGCTLTGNVRNAFYFSNCTVSGNLYWTDVNSFHPVFTSFAVPADAVLQIEPGAIIKLSSDAISVSGSLRALGNAEQPIIFTSYLDDNHGGDTNGDNGATSPSPGNWGGITCWYTTAVNQFQYCEFYYGSNLLTIQGCPQGMVSHCTFGYGSNVGLTVNSSPQQVLDCSFHHNNNHGLYVSNVNMAIPVSNCNFYNNNGYAAWFEYYLITPNSGNTQTNNLRGGFCYNNSTISGHVVWNNALGIITNGITVPAADTLELLPGTIIKSTNGAWNVRGRLISSGTASSPIIYTSYYDDAHGGDTNGDGTSTLPSPNQWGGISCNNSTWAPSFTYCEFWYGAYGTGWMLSLDNVPPGLVQHCLFSYSQNYGLNISNSSPLVDNCTFSNNLLHGLYAYNAGANMTIRDCTFTNNSGNAAMLDNSTFTNFSGCTQTNNLRGGFRYNNCTVSGHVVWSDAMRIIVNGLVIPAADTLEILPGTVVKNTYGTWTVNGRLISNGTASAHIVYTSYYDDAHGGDTNGDGNSGTPAPNQWGGLCFINTSVAPHLSYNDFLYGAYGTGYLVSLVNPPGGQIDHCSFSYSQNNGLQVYNCNPTIEDCSFASNILNGLYAYNTGASLILHNNTFSHNTSFGAWFENCTINSYPGNIMTNNTAGNYRYNNCTVSGHITFTPADHPVLNGLTVPPSQTLEILPGTVIKSISGSLAVSGQIIATGTAASPIIFTSYYDDAHGGDTNGDSGTYTPAPNQWGNLSISNSSQAPHLEYCEFWYGAYCTGNNLLLNNLPGGYVSHCTFTYSQNFGMQISGCSPQIEDCTFSNNISHGLFIYDASPTLRRCHIRNNTGYGILIQGASSPDLGTESDYGYNFIVNNHADQIQLANQSNNTIHAIGNVWQWNNPLTIDAHIIDNEEYGYYGEVLFQPSLADIPATPVITSVQYSGASVIITWEPVTWSSMGNNIVVDSYRVEASPDPFGETWTSIGSSSSTSFTLSGAALEPAIRFFRVVAVY